MVSHPITLQVRDHTTDTTWTEYSTATLTTGLLNLLLGYVLSTHPSLIEWPYRQLVRDQVLLVRESHWAMQIALRESCSGLSIAMEAP